VPTSADDVYFDAASGLVTCTIAAGSAGAKSINCTGFTGTLSYATNFTVSGSVTLAAGMTFLHNFYTTTFNGTGTLTTAGKLYTEVIINGVGATVTLGSALTANGRITVTSGTFRTNNFNVTASQLWASGAFTRGIDLGSSTVTLTAGSSTALNFQTNSGLTFNAGTSTIVCSGAQVDFAAGLPNNRGNIFNNVSFTATAITTHRIQGINTFNNLTVRAPSTTGVTTVTFDSEQTINGTLGTTDTAGNRRVFFTTSTYGISYDLFVNGVPNLIDCDFRGLYVRGRAAPISGTRIGNRGECSGITFSTPKNVYRVGSDLTWSTNSWALTSGGVANTNNFPLPQDTAIFTNASPGNFQTLSLDSLITSLPSMNFSGRTANMTFSFAASATCYGNWTSGTGVSYSTGGILTFSGGSTQTIVSSGQQFSCPINIDTYGGTVQLADSLNLFQQTLTVVNGTFNTQGYAVALGLFTSSNTNVRTINLGASTITSSIGFSTNIDFTTTTNLTFNAGTSQITLTSSFSKTILANNVPFYNLSCLNNSDSFLSITGNNNTFNNLSIAASSFSNVQISGNHIINGTLTLNGASAIARIFLQTNALHTQYTLTVNSLVSTNCDFRDIRITGAATGSSPTGAGNCGNNSGIVFPAPKTVYWNLAGTQNWDATGWALTSGGTPSANNFPLAQDIAIFDNAGAAGTITIGSRSIGTFDASNRTNAMTLNTATNFPRVYGNWRFGTGVTVSSTNGSITFSGETTQTITSNGVVFNCPVSINSPRANVLLADALSLQATRMLAVSSGRFDAVSYNVTVGQFQTFGTTATTTIRMGSGTWTLLGTGSVWELGFSNPNVIIGTSTIVLSDTSTSARTFSGRSYYYNKLTIGGTTGTSTLTITGNNSFGELASTKTVAHTIAFGSDFQTFGKWSVTGTAGNVVTITGTSTANIIAGPAVTGVDYLAMGTWGLSGTSPGEFYAGANSTGTAAAPVFRTAAPAPRTLYWVGGSGGWSFPTKWDTVSGGGGGAAIPTSLDAVIFNSASSAAAYTATISVVTLARCASFTMAGPASGNVTFAGSVGIAFHGNVSFAATGITRTYTGAMYWAGNSSYTFTTNGLVLNSTCFVTGVGSAWTLGSDIDIGSAPSLIVNYGLFSTSANNRSLNASQLSSNNNNVRTINLNGSTLAIGASQPVAFNPLNLTFNAGTSTIINSSTVPIFNGAGQTFNNVNFTQPSSLIITGANTFNTLSVPGRTTVGMTLVTFSANQTINTLTLGAGTASAFRTFLASDTIGTTRTLTVGTLTAGAADIDFRDITIAGAAAPISGTRFGDAKGNSGITFPAAKTVYAVAAGANSNWGTASTGLWSTSSTLGTQSASDFPLAQDTAVILAATPASGSTLIINANYNIGTIDMSARTTNTMTLATGTQTPGIYGNWINGTGTTLTGTGVMTFAGRGSQTITSAGRTFTQSLRILSPGGSVTMLDALTSNRAVFNAIDIDAGTFNAATYNVTLSGGILMNNAGFGARAIAFGSGTWTISAASAPLTLVPSGNIPTITGTGTINFNSAFPKLFDGGSLSYSGITINQGGVGELNINGNNTFKTITNSAIGTTAINLGSTTQTLTQPWAATGAEARILIIQGTSAASPATLRFTGAGSAANVNHLLVRNVRTYSINTWNAGANSFNSGSLGWVLTTAAVITAVITGFFTLF
jgi:hypothetical protein